MHVGILGPGRLGRSLEILLARAGHAVHLVGRGEVPRGDVVLLCVPDTAIREAAAALPLGRPVLHCSGATDLQPLAPHQPAGSLHPLMTFPGPEALPDLDGVAAAIAGDTEAKVIARELAMSLGMSPFEVTGDRRLYHAAAVISGNFGTVLLEAATRALVAAGAPRDQAAAILLPLALQSLRNAPPDPAAALTGPVARGDWSVIQAHREALEEAGFTDIVELYDAATEYARKL